jgi:hypothetical protein
MGNIPRSYAAGSYFLTLDGTACGFLRSASGGEAVGEVVSASPGPGQFADKHIGSVRHEELVLEVGIDLGKELYDWIDKSWQLEQPRKQGSIAAVATDGSIQSERAFVDALISEVTVPKLDASSKEPAFLTVRLAPDRVELAKGGGRRAAARAPKPKQFMASNFRLEIDGLDCKRVMSVDSFTVSQTEGLAAVEFPNLRITLAASSADSWDAWYDDFLVQGNNGADRERSGSISFLAPNLKAELGRVELANLGIFALRRPPAATAEQVAKVVAGLYCERMSLHVGG